MATTPEGRVKKAVKKLLEQHNVWYYMPMQNGFGVQGIPDFVCCMRGQFLAIETKAPGKHTNLSPWQIVRRDEIIKAKGAYLVISDVKQLEDWFNAN